MFNFATTKLLIIAPHPDDEVIGCGGLISKIKSAGGQVFVLFMTVGTTVDFTGGGQRSLASQRLKELKQVARHLRFDGWRIALSGNQFHLQLDQVPQLKLIHEIERGDKISLEKLHPDILAIPSLVDYNQDHRAVALASLAACRPVPLAEKYTPPLIISYETPMNSWSVSPQVTPPNIIFELSKQNLKDKIDGMAAYNSQLRTAGHPRNCHALTALACLRGTLIGVPLAEAFYCHKFVPQ